MKASKFLYKSSIIAVAVIFLAGVPFFVFFVSEEFFKDKNDEELTIRDLKTRDGLAETAEAAGGLPFIFGGRVIKYQPACVVDNTSGTCESSCPMCSRMVGQACSGYQEIQFEPVIGSTPTTPPGTVCVLQADAATVFKGGVPYSGVQILGGGVSPQKPWVIGVAR